MTISKIDENWIEETTFRGEPWKYRGLSGEHLGVWIEILEPGATSSEHHYHTTEEGHLIILEVEGTLPLCEDKSQVQAGDHMWFKAGDAVAHHIRNTSNEPLRFLVFGERKREDVVDYPTYQVMMIKAEDYRRLTYRDIPNTSESSTT